MINKLSSTIKSIFLHINLNALREISSTQNPLIKHIVDLKSKSASRKEYRQCVIEGKKELEIALESGVKIEKLLIERGTEIPFPWIKLIDEIYECTSIVIDKIAVRDLKEKFIAVAQTRYLSLQDVKLSPNAFVLILENVEKPGNLGSLFRTSDAADVDLIICTDMTTDLYNPNVIRNSLGCVFSKQIVFCSNQDALAFCQKHKIAVHATYLHTDYSYYQQDFQKSTAIVFGTESTGITEFWQKQSDALIKIPMKGKIDSMNVSNSASILLYEVVRQREVE